jgi:hypothetical protein
MTSLGSSLSRTGGTGCLLFVALFWSSLTLTFDGFFAWSAFWQLRATLYPTTVGQVTRSEVEVFEGEDGSTYRPKIHYTYAVAGVRYEGDRYRYGQFSSGDNSARRTVDAHPVGRQVEVRYHPSDPADAVLLCGLEGSDLFGPLFMLPFNVVMVVLWAAAGQGLVRRIFPSPAGGAKVREDGRCVRVRLSGWRPLAVGIATATAIAIVLVFVVAFTGGSNPPLPIVLGAWGLILAGGLAAWGFQYAKVVRGDWDLLIDEYRQSLTLPRTCGRREEVVVPAEKVTAIEIERAEKRNSEGRVTRSFIPTLLVTDGDGTIRREKLIDWSDEASAQGLTAWLRERLKIS